MNAKSIFAIVVGLAAQGFFTNYLVAGTSWSGISAVPIRESGVNYYVSVITTMSGQIVDYTNDDNTDPSHPQTSKGRYFDHLHIDDLSSPMWANAVFIDTSGNPHYHAVTADKIRAFWDNYYSNQASGYINIGGLTYAYNCHGFAMGNNCFVQKTAYLDADNYTNASGWMDCTILRNGDAHSISVTGYSSVSDSEALLYGISTSEKNQASDIYTNYWYCTTPIGASTQMKPQ